MAYSPQQLEPPHASFYREVATTAPGNELLLRNWKPVFLCPVRNQLHKGPIPELFYLYIANSISWIAFIWVIYQIFTGQFTHRDCNK